MRRMGDQIKNAVIGVFVLAALVIVVFILLFLHPSIGDEGQVLFVRFSDIDKVNIGTPVTYAGKAIGEVAEIRTLHPGRNGKHDAYGHIFVYELKLLIDSNILVYDTDHISLRTAGLLGERSISIMPFAPPEGVTPKRITKDDIVYATETGSVEDAIKEFKEVADKFDKALDGISDILEAVKKEELIKHITSVAHNISDITGALNKPTEWSEILDNFHSATTEMAERLPHSWDLVDVSLTNAKDFTGNTRTLVAGVSEGKGTAGKLMVDEDLYLNLKSILNKVEVIADDVNHYGLLFQSDKGWQRLRARRMNLLQKLCTPQEFRNYFNDEINQITTSLSRVSMVLDKTGQCCPYGSCYSLMEDQNFTKVFAELIRRVGDMEESLMMYNQQLVDCQVFETELTPCSQ